MVELDLAEAPEHSQLLELLDHVADAVLIVDGDWYLRYANRRAAAWLAGRGPLRGARLGEIVPELRDSAFRATYERAMASGEPGHVEAFAPGFNAWFDVDVYRSAGQLAILVRDVTDRRREELGRELITALADITEASDGTIQALRNATTRLRQMTGYEIGKVWLRDHRGTARLVGWDHTNRPEFEEFAARIQQVGLTPDSLAAQAMTSGAPVTVDDLEGESDRQRAAAAKQAGLRAGIYLPITWSDGVNAVIGLLTTGGPGHDDWCTILTGLHPRLQALAVRMRRRQELMRLFELAREGLCIAGADGWFHRVNPELARMLGRSVAELYSRPFLDFVHPEDRSMMAAAFDRLMAGEPPRPFEHRVVVPSGEERILAWTSRAMPEEQLLYSAARDVTEERRRERFGDDQREILRAIALGAPVDETLDRLIADAETWLPDTRVSVWLVDRESHTLYPAAAPTLPSAYLEAVAPIPIETGQGPIAEAVLTDRRVILPYLEEIGDPPTFLRASIRHGLRACWAVPFHGTESEALGVLVFHPDRRSRPARQQLETIEDAARLVGVALARHRSQAALTASEERFRLMADVATDAMWDWDVVTDDLWFSEGFRERFGYSEADRTDGYDLWVRQIHDEDRDRVLRSLEAAIDSGQEVLEDEYRFHRKDGSVAVVVDRATIIRDEWGRAVRLVGGMSDETARREREQANQRLARMESLGGLAGGMAHDLNNVLAPILMSAELLKRMDHGDDVDRMAERIERSARRGGEMIRQVLQFARGTEGERVAVDIVEVLDDIVDHAQGAFDSRVEVVKDVPRDLPAVRGDATQLHQVLLNLVVNARDAMPDGGRVTLAAGEVGVVADPGAGTRRVRMRVVDTGTGMTADVRQQIFDPFFTTKSNGEGTGLGLATSLAIVEGHGGTMDVDSEVAGGTTFTVDLPVFEVS